MTLHKIGRFGVIEQFIADDFKCMFGNPGSTESGFLDALTHYPALRYILGLHETVVIGMADAYARATKKPTLAQVHSPAGLGNALGMLYQAHRGNAPLVLIAGSSGIQYNLMEGLLSGNMVEMARPFTKWSTRVVSSKSLLRVLRRAVKEACTPPMGPVFIDLPMDILDEDLVEEVFATPIPDTRTVPQDAPLLELAETLLSAENPMFVIGDEISVSAAQEALAEVARLTGAEVWGANCHEVNMSHRNPQFMGVLGWNSGADAREKLKEADVVLVLGTSMTPQLFPETGNVFPPQCKVFHIGLNAHDMGKNYPMHMGFASDLKLTLSKVSDMLKTRITAEQSARAQKRVEEIALKNTKAEEELLRQDDARQSCHPMDPSLFMKQFARQAPPDTVVFDEAITSSASLTRYYKPTEPGQYFLLRGGVLGAGISGAVGLKLANPDKTVVGFAGDGASLFSIHGLWTAARYNLNVKFVICNDRSYRILKINERKYWKSIGVPEGIFPPFFDLEDPEINFVKLGESFGVPGIRVASADQIQPALEQMMNIDGPCLIDLVIRSEIDDCHPAEERTFCQ